VEAIDFYGKKTLIFKSEWWKRWGKNLSTFLGKIKSIRKFFIISPLSQSLKSLSLTFLSNLNKILFIYSSQSKNQSEVAESLINYERN
jgi:hypothetical protein